MMLNGVAYDKGFGVNAPSMLTFTLPAGHEYVTFRSNVGYDDDVNNAPMGATMEFRVFTQHPAPDDSAPVALDLASIGFTADQPCRITEMWTGVDMGIYRGNEFAPVLRSHASGLYRVTPVGETEGIAVHFDEDTDHSLETTPWDSVHMLSSDRGLRIMAESPCKLNLYALNGTLLRELTLSRGENVINLSAGSYVIADRVVMVK